MAQETLKFNDIKTCVGRVLYPKLNPEAPTDNLNGEKEWSITLAFDPKDPAFAQTFFNELKSAKSQFISHYGLEPVHFPQLKTMDVWANQKQTRKTPEDLVGFMQLSLRQKAFSKDGSISFPPPQLFGANSLPTIYTTFYSGCYARAIFTPRVYTSPTNQKGVTIDLKAVQFVRDGESLAGQKDYSNAFEALEPEPGTPDGLVGQAFAL